MVIVVSECQIASRSEVKEKIKKTTHNTTRNNWSASLNDLCGESRSFIGGVHIRINHNLKLISTQKIRAEFVVNFLSKSPAVSDQQCKSILICRQADKLYMNW